MRNPSAKPIVHLWIEQIESRVLLASQTFSNSGSISIADSFSPNAIEGGENLLMYVRTVVQNWRPDSLASLLGRRINSRCRAPSYLGYIVLLKKKTATGS